MRKWLCDEELKTRNFSMTYLVTGATGTVGSRVVELLAQRGLRPRVFVRNAEKARAQLGDGVDISVGDLADAASLRAALDGVNALFLVNSGPELARRDQTTAIAAKSAGVQRLVKLSSMDAGQQVGTGAWHAQGEAAIRAVGIPFTFVQPAGFMSNAHEWAATIKTEGVVRSPTGDGKIPFIHPDDIAAVATEALTDPQYIEASVPITGPQALSYAEMTAQLAAAIGKTLRFESVSEEQEQREMLQAGAPPEIVAAHLSIYRAIREGRLATVTDNVERILNRKPRSFAQWAQENAGVFQ
jgi:(4-alkanoyl-5-oxo-2,5-dihydrofuran-3-yl)methyl phosphate reductase